MVMALKAFKTILYGLTSLVPASSPGEAKSITKRSAESAGWIVEWTKIKVHRDPSHDEWAQTAKKITWNPKVVP